MARKPAKRKKKRKGKKPGRKRWIPTREILEKVEQLAAIGLKKQDIAWNIGLHPDNLSRKMEEFDQLYQAMEGGRAKARAEMRSALTEEARKREPWAFQLWFRYNDQATERVIHAGDPKNPVVFTGTKHAQPTPAAAGETLAILDTARKERKARSKSSNT